MRLPWRRLECVVPIRLLIRQRRTDNHRSIKAVLQACVDVCVVGEVAEHVELLVAVRDTGANAVLLIINPEEDEGMLSHLFAEYPDLTLLTMPDGQAPAGSVFIEQRCRARRTVADTSPAGIVQALRTAVREPAELIGCKPRLH